MVQCSDPPGQRAQGDSTAGYALAAWRQQPTNTTMRCDSCVLVIRSYCSMHANGPHCLKQVYMRPSVVYTAGYWQADVWDCLDLSYRIHL